MVSTIARLQGRVGLASTHGATLAAIIKELGVALPAKPAEAPLAWITASSGKETRLIMVDDVAYFRSDHKYTTVMTAQGEALLRTPLQELLAKLDPSKRPVPASCQRQD